jgi:hypothetical protein
LIWRTLAYERVTCITWKGFACVLVFRVPGSYQKIREFQPWVAAEFILKNGRQSPERNTDWVLGKKRDREWQVYCWKVAKNFGQYTILSAREIEHGRFRALFADGF